MKAMGENGTSSYSPVASSAVNTVIRIQTAFGAWQRSIDGAVADMPNATTPHEAKKAQQLQEAKVMQVNEAPVMKLKV
jgi:hypothetical protein